MFDKIEKYGLRLIRLKEEHLETVRGWRNSEYVKSKMIFQENITAEMQYKWFLKINNDRNYYFIVEHNNKWVGVADIKDIKDGSGEPGFYLCKQEYEDTEIAALLSVALGDFGFNTLDLNKFYIHVLKNNDRAMKYNLFLDYKIIPEKSTTEIAYMELPKETYNKKTKLLKKYLLKSKA